MTHGIIERLERASGRDQQLDKDIAEVCSVHVQNWRHQPNYTSSIDSALTLVPEGFKVQMLGQHRHFENVTGWHDGWHCILSKDGKEEDESTSFTPAIALCIAALKARKGEG